MGTQSKQPEALRLADALKSGNGWHAPSLLHLRACDELRRQHVELQMTSAAYESACGELRKQEALIADLVVALQLSVAEFGDNTCGATIRRAHDALAKAKNY